MVSSLDEHLGRGIRHDDVYEELAPTTYCKTKKRTLTVPALFIPLLISGEGADRWFCREKGSTEYKSIQENGSKCTTKYKSKEPKMAAHYKIQNKDH